LNTKEALQSDKTL